MILSDKHGERKQTLIKADFSGGLNTSINVDGIAENQLAVAMNVEADHSTGRLKTVAGTKDVMNFGKKIFAAIYDEINKCILIVTTDKFIYYVNVQTLASTMIGILSGDLYPITAAWEDGVLIASGGQLQYFDGSTLQTISSPTAKAVFVRAGRILINDEDNIHFSGVGDETQWTDISNDDSTSKFVEVGYKDGGHIIGFVSLYNDVLIIKENRRVYRLQGEYPNWTIGEVSRNVECSGRLSFCNIADQVFILGNSEFQNITTMQAYGDVKPQNVAQLITKEIQKLPENAIVRFVPPLNQIWIFGQRGSVLIFDLNFNSWYQRQFNSEIIDVVSIGNAIFVIKPDRISQLDENIFYDNGLPLRWKFQAQRLISLHDFLVKRSQISVVPMSAELYAGEISIGAIVIPLPVPSWTLKTYNNKARVYKNHVKTNLIDRRHQLYTKGENAFDNTEPVFGNENKLFSRQTYIKQRRQIFRSKFLDIKGNGSLGGFLLNSIIIDIVEV